MHIQLCVSSGQRTVCRSRFSPLAVWTQGLELRFFKLGSKHFTNSHLAGPRNGFTKLGLLKFIENMELLSFMIHKFVFKMLSYYFYSLTHLIMID